MERLINILLVAAPIAWAILIEVRRIRFKKAKERNYASYKSDKLKK